MRVGVVPHDPRWADMFRAEAAVVTAVLGPNACRFHHIGSTAIPGLHAKPIIDMLIEAHDLGDVNARNPAMAEVGCEALEDEALSLFEAYLRQDGSLQQHVRWSR